MSGNPSGSVVLLLDDVLLPLPQPYSPIVLELLVSISAGASCWYHGYLPPFQAKVAPEPPSPLRACMSVLRQATPRPGETHLEQLPYPLSSMEPATAS